MYPNPSESVVNLTNVDSAVLQGVQIYAVNGQLVLETSESTIDISALQNGVYFVKVQTRDSQSVLRFVKQ